MNSYNIVNYCIRNRYFTAGSNSQYEKLQQFADSNPNDFRTVATMIWICSDTTKSIEEIAKDLQDME